MGLSTRTHRWRIQVFGEEGGGVLHEKVMREGVEELQCRGMGRDVACAYANYKIRGMHCTLKIRNIDVVHINNYIHNYY